LPHTFGLVGPVCCETCSPLRFAGGWTIDLFGVALGTDSLRFVSICTGCPEALLGGTWVVTADGQCRAALGPEFDLESVVCPVGTPNWPPGEALDANLSDPDCRGVITLCAFTEGSAVAADLLELSVGTAVGGKDNPVGFIAGLGGTFCALPT